MVLTSSGSGALGFWMALIGIVLIVAGGCLLVLADAPRRAMQRVGRWFTPRRKTAGGSAQPSPTPGFQPMAPAAGGRPAPVPYATQAAVTPLPSAMFASAPPNPLVSAPSPMPAAPGPGAPVPPAPPGTLGPAASVLVMPAPAQAAAPAAAPPPPGGNGASAPADGGRGVPFVAPLPGQAQPAGWQPSGGQHVAPSRPPSNVEKLRGDLKRAAHWLLGR